MGSNCIKVRVLPDIEMYGGDTTPWQIALVNANGVPLKVDAGADCTVTLSVAPYKVTTGLGHTIEEVPLVLTKDGVMETGEDDDIFAVFEFTETDTKTLNGKYVYQVDVRHGSNVRVGQGVLHVFQNIN